MVKYNKPTHTGQSGFSNSLSLRMHISVEDATRLAKETTFATAHIHAQTHISEIHPDGVHISKPGTYTFTKDVVWCPRRRGGVAISVTCSDVTIDFSNFCLIKSEKRCVLSGQHITQCVGVRVGSVHRVSLCCGTVRGFDQYSVIAIGTHDLVLNRMIIQDLQYAHTHLPLPLPLASSSSSTLRGHKHRRRQHVTAGIMLSGCHRPRVVWSACEMFCGKHRGLHTAVQLQSCTNAVVEDVRVLKQKNDTGSCVGVAAFLCDGVSVARCHVGGVSAHEFIAGVALVGCVRVHVSATTIGSIVAAAARGGAVYGMYMARCTGGPALVEACTINHVGVSATSATSATSSKDDDGDDGDDGDDDVKDAARVLSATGVWVLQCNNVHFLRCAVSQVSADEGHAAGFLDGDTQNVAYVNCSVDAVAAVGYSVGFGGIRHLFAPSLHTSYTSCQVTNCSIGYDLTTHQKYSMKGCTARQVSQKSII